MAQVNRAARDWTEIPREGLELYGFVAQVIAGADGELTRQERELLFDEGRRFGIDEGVLDAWAKFDWRMETVKSMVPKLLPFLTPKLARQVIYDAIRIARADGVFPIEERAAVDEAAELLGIEQHQVQSLLALVELEQAVDTLRRSLRID